MAQILNYLYVAAAVIFLFGAAIFIHEFGHFWVARRRGLKVEAFAIGFGPKIFGWTRDGIEYSWRLIPAGGYVKLPQMVTSQQLEGANTEPAEQVPPASPLSKILVAFAGPVMNVIFAIAIACIIYFVGLPVPVNPSIVGYVDPASPEYQAGIREGDKRSRGRTCSWKP
jgi:regulator of sigma E protease